MLALIGIDCATQPRKVGLALGYSEGDRVRIVECRAGSPAEPPATIVRGWLARHERALIALDAPLGWARPLGPALATHTAGEPIAHGSNALFRRYTDDAIHARFGKRPLEVGANFISRTAVAALGLLREIGDDGAQDVPLAWDATRLEPVAAIEVYPAATRLARGAVDRGGSLEGLEGWLALSGDIEASRLTADAVDAMVCVLAGADFVEGRAVGPEDLELARAEGWIWAARGRGILQAHRPA